MSEHHDPEEFDVFRRAEDIAWRWWVRVVVVVVGGGEGEDDKAKFPNGRPLDVLASGEQSECGSGERKITALY